MAGAELNFLEFIQSFRRGELLAEGDSLLNELVDAVKLTGGKGAITLVLPLAMNKAGQLECQPSMTVKKPRRAIGTGIYYATDDGRLSRRDPNQHEMFDELGNRRDRDD